jgi:undecaprenyl-diphosphatase
MDALIVATAQYLIYGVLAAAALAWLLLPRHRKVEFAFMAAIALLAALALIRLAAALHYDPRPFEVNPAVKPLFAHAADNGFPSDHVAVAATVALLVLARRRVLGAALLIASALIGVSRVSAHVHHAEDIVASLVIALVAVAVALMVWRWSKPRLTGRLATLASDGRT